MIRGMLASRGSQGSADSKGTRVCVARPGCRVLVEKLDRRANQVKRALMVHLVLLASRVSRVTSALRDKMAPKDPRESKGYGASRVQEEHLVFRVTRERSGPLDSPDSRAGLGGRDSLD